METPTLSKYEMARLIGARSLQLSFGAPPLLEVSGSETCMQIAFREFDAGVIPLVVLR